MNETIAKEEQAQPEPKFDWDKVKFEEWETPEAELEAEPEYQHLLAVCNELGLNL